jgi:hypothetical protein
VVQLQASDLAQKGVLRITAFTPPPGGGTTNEVMLPVVIDHPVTGFVTLPVQGEQVIADPTRSRLYVSVLATDPAAPGTVAVIDGASGGTIRSYAVSPVPGTLAISSDGHFLYVASRGAPVVDRIDLVAGSVLSISLQIGSPTDQPRALDMVPLTGAAGSVLVTLDLSAAGNTPGLVVFDGQVPRPRTTAISMSRIEPSPTADVMYGLLGTSFYRLVIRNDGVLVATEIPALVDVAISDIQQLGGKVYASNGGIYDLEVGRVVGTFSHGSGLFFIDGPRNRAFFTEGGVFTVWARDLATNDLIGLARIDSPNGFRGNLTSFGTDGIALFTDDQHLVLFHSTLVSQ